VSTSVVPPANDAAPPRPEEILELAHHHPGRLRVRADVLRSSQEHSAEALAAQVREALEGVSGIRSVAHNARTGSLLVEYEPGLLEPDVIATRIAEIAGLVSPFDPRAARPVFRPASAVIDGTRGLNAIAEELTGGRADLRAIVPAALAGAAAVSFLFGKGPRLPRWDNLMWWSYSVFASLHARDIARASGTQAPPEGLDLP
jgi:hypothetical protein